MILPAEQERLNLPLNVQEEYCKCGKPNLICYSLLGWVSPRNDDGLTIQQRISKKTPLGMFCSICLKPSRYSLYHTIRACEVCGTYYVPVPAKWTYPIKNFLCAKHHVPSRKEIMLRKKEQINESNCP